MILFKRIHFCQELCLLASSSHPYPHILIQLWDTLDTFLPYSDFIQSL